MHAGVVITNEPVVDYVPLYVNEGNISTQFVMTVLEELGLLKMDFLGLRTLTVISDSVKLIKKYRGIDVEIDKEMNDPEVFKVWQSGASAGIFQFESNGMTSFMKELKPDCLEDIIAGVSLYRPGPMDQIPRYIKNKLNPENSDYTHPALEQILNVTYGCMVYQEQVMQIVRDLAGYSLGRADLVRRAMSKKKLDVMDQEREFFVNGEIDKDGNVLIPGCVRNGIDAKSANKIFDEMAEFAKYAFNKSHAAAYAVIAYQTAFLKTYYKPEFMAATLNSYLGNLDKIPEYIEECKKLNIEILSPNINKSYAKFTVENKGEGIRFGLGSIKNVGMVAVNTIIEERNKNGEFKSFTSFLERMAGEAINKKCIESLIRAGAFGEFEQTRATLLESFESILDTINNSEKKSIAGQIDIFGMGTNSTSSLENMPEEPLQSIKYSFCEMPEHSEKDLLAMEKEMLGIYISGHPLDKLRDVIKQYTNIDTKELTKIEEENRINDDGKQVKYAGIITSVKKKYTRNNSLMAFVSVEDLYGVREIIVFDSTYRKVSDFLLNDNIVLVEGRLSIREDDEAKIVASDIRMLDVNTQEEPKENNLDIDSIICEEETKISSASKVFSLDITDIDEETKARLRGMIRFFIGDKNNMPIQVVEKEEVKPCGAIYLTEEIKKQFEDLLGKERVIW